MTLRTRPRPILKRDSSPPPLANDLPFTTCDYILSPHVHFPPTPWMHSMRFTHSPHTYDRAPILVSPNERLLLKRRDERVYSPPADADDGRRGRSRTRARDYGSDTEEEEEDVKGSYFHPRAYEACTPEPLDAPTTSFDVPSLPSLVPDLSPSDETDDLVTTPPDPKLSALITTPIPPLFIYPSDSHAPSSIRTDECSPAQFRSSVLPAHTDGKNGRPGLKRNDDVKVFVSFSPRLDEGCLGGF